MIKRKVEHKNNKKVCCYAVEEGEGGGIKQRGKHDHKPTKERKNIITPMEKQEVSKLEERGQEGSRRDGDSLWD